MTDGLLIAQDRKRTDILYTTTDAGATWVRDRPPPPPALPRNAETWLFPVISPEGADLLTLRTVSRSEATARPLWEGTFGYARSGDGWAGPYRLPMAPATLGPDILVPGADGRLWGAYGHDLWVADDLVGPWHRRRVPLPDEESIDGIYPVGDGCLWLTTTVGVAGGRLYRSEDDGAHWTGSSVDA